MDLIVKIMMVCMFFSLGIVTILSLIAFYVWLLDRRDNIDPVQAPPGAQAFEDGTYSMVVPREESPQAHPLQTHPLQGQRGGSSQQPSEPLQHKPLQ